MKMFTDFLTLFVFPTPCPLLSQLCAKRSSLHKVDSRTNFQVFMDFMMSMKAAAKPIFFNVNGDKDRSIDNHILYFHMQ